VEEAGTELRGLGVGVERALIRQHVDLQPKDPPVLGESELTRHVVIAGEAG
jgi:hypothetical protein